MDEPDRAGGRVFYSGGEGMMPEWIQALILISSGIGLGLLCFLAGSWIMFRGKSTPGTGEGFLKDPKGDVFTVTDGLDEQLFNAEPGPEEQNILNNTKKFLKALGGEE